MRCTIASRGVPAARRKVWLEQPLKISGSNPCPVSETSEVKILRAVSKPVLIVILFSAVYNCERAHSVVDQVHEDPTQLFSIHMRR